MVTWASPWKLPEYCGDIVVTIPTLDKSPRRDLNSRPLVYKTSALTTELRRRDIWVAMLDHYHEVKFDRLAIAFLINWIATSSYTEAFRFQQSGAEEACWAHNPEVGGSKPPSATYTFSNFECRPERRILGKFENGACPGVEPGTSRTRSANHTTRPTGHCIHIANKGTITGATTMTSVYHLLFWRCQIRSKTSRFALAGFKNCRPASTYRVSISNCVKMSFNICSALARRHDEVAEWLRRWTANPLGSARVGSNPILVEPGSMV